MTYVKSPQQLNVTKRDLMFKVKDALGCSKPEAIMYMATLAHLEKAHPEYKIQDVPPDQLIQFIKIVRNKQLDKMNLDKQLNGPQNDVNNINNFLSPNK